MPPCTCAARTERSNARHIGADEPLAQPPAQAPAERPLRAAECRERSHFQDSHAESRASLHRRACLIALLRCTLLTHTGR